MAIPANFRQNRQVYSGNVVTIEIANSVVGLAQNLRTSDNYGLQPASGVGDIHVQEFVPGLAQHSLQFSQLLLYTGSFEDLGDGHVFENGDSALRGLEFDVVVRGKNTAGIDNPAGSDRVVAKYVGCVFESGDVDVRAHAILVKSASFRARDRVHDVNSTFP